MPCRDGGPSYGYEREQQERLDTVTRLLCETCQMLEDHDELSYLSQETRDWWEEHKLEDEEREKEERRERAREKKRVEKEIARLQKKLKKMK